MASTPKTAQLIRSLVGKPYSTSVQYCLRNRSGLRGVKVLPTDNEHHDSLPSSEPANRDSADTQADAIRVHFDSSVAEHDWDGTHGELEGKQACEDYHEKD